MRIQTLLTLLFGVTFLAVAAAAKKPAGNGPTQEEFYKVRAVLRVSPAASSQVLYEIEAAPLSNSLTGAAGPVDEPLPAQRRNAIYGAFWKLTEDVHRVAPSSSK